MTDLKRIPIFSKTGTDIIAWAVIDEEDYPSLINYRWQLTPDNRIVRNHISGNLRLLVRQILNINIQDRASVTHIDGDTLNCQKENLRIVKGDSDDQ